MTGQDTVENYIKKAQDVFCQIQCGKPKLAKEANEVLESAERYLKDAIYYRNQSRFETALASIVYCEGLLDALRLLGMVEFRWPPKHWKKNNQ